MQKRPFKDIHIKAIKLLKSGMTEHKIAETLGKSRCWVQTVKRSPGFQEVFDSVDISDVLILNLPAEDDFEAIVEDIAEQILEPEPESIVQKIRRIEAGVVHEPERLECLTHYQKIQRYQQRLEKLGRTSLEICEMKLELLKQRVETMTPEEISARNITLHLKQLGDTVIQANELLARSLGIEKLQEVVKAELEISEDELEFIDV